jgi:hypothetical protein
MQKVSLANTSQSKAPSAAGARPQAHPRRRRTWAATLAAVLLAAALVAGAAFGLPHIKAQINAQAAASIKQSILASATQCAAIEGAYPMSLEYLEANYGLVLNHTDFAITYVAFASNVAPSVQVVPK